MINKCVCNGNILQKQGSSSHTPYMATPPAVPLYNQVPSYYPQQPHSNYHNPAIPAAAYPPPPSYPAASHNPSPYPPPPSPYPPPHSYPPSSAYPPPSYPPPPGYPPNAGK